MYAIFLFCIILGGYPPEPSPDSTEIAQLIQQLGDDNYKKREAARQELLDIGLPALEPLKQALNDPDLEISSSAKNIIESYFFLDHEEFSVWALPEIARYANEKDMAREAYIKVLAWPRVSDFSPFYQADWNVNYAWNNYHSVAAVEEFIDQWLKAGKNREDLKKILRIAEINWAEEKHLSNNSDFGEWIPLSENVPDKIEDRLKKLRKACDDNLAKPPQPWIGPD